MTAQTPQPECSTSKSGQHCPHWKAGKWACCFCAEPPPEKKDDPDAEMLDLARMMGGE